MRFDDTQWAHLVNVRFPPQNQTFLCGPKPLSYTGDFCFILLDEQQAKVSGQLQGPRRPGRQARRRVRAEPEAARKSPLQA